MARQSKCHGKRVKVEDRLRVSSLLAPTGSWEKLRSSGLAARAFTQ